MSDETLAEAGHDVRRMPMGYECAVHTHMSWVPIERHHVWPKGLGGPDVEGNKITVCVQGHYEIHAYLDHLIKGTTHDVARHFGPKVKHYAVSGWEQAGKPTHGGGGE